MVPVHLHRIGVKEDKFCECGEIGTLNHIFFECNRFMAQSSVLYDSLTIHFGFAPHNISSVMHVHPTILFAFAKFLEDSGVKL